MSALRAPLWHRILTHAVLIVVVVVTLYPIVQILGISLRPGDRLYCMACMTRMEVVRGEAGHLEARVIY